MAIAISARTLLLSGLSVRERLGIRLVRAWNHDPILEFATARLWLAYGPGEHSGSTSTLIPEKFPEEAFLEKPFM